MQITPPLTDETVAGLRAGQRANIRGTIYVARDAAHKRMVEALKRGEPLPFDARGQIVYYMGPTPARPGRPIGSAGPTTSGRMDAYAEAMLKAGLKGMLGKGNRSSALREALQKYKAVYLVATGGAGALIGQSIKRAECVAYADLGPEALLRLEVEDLPVIVADDIYGGDAYEIGTATYRT